VFLGKQGWRQKINDVSFEEHNHRKAGVKKKEKE
jgi:hypothetical protein